ncbi:MAG: FHA domain-containing serine/threonine-protein kinase [Anaerolineae bacterium]|jgi:serine/threonine protein kinase
MKDLIGKQWGRFQIIEERGRGGMAVVYKAYDTVLQRTVALKVLLPLLAANREFTRRFSREAITAANLKHQGIVVIHDVGSYENFQYIVMEYLEGPTLQQEIQEKGAMPITRVSSILGQLAEALDYAHGQELIHRDVKPANIIIGAQECVTLTDFGLVKAATNTQITGEGAAIGTLKYMSPEQAQGREIDSRSDIYSLGVVVYEMLIGETPFAGTTPYQTLQQLIHDSPPPLTQRNPQIPARVEQVVLQALAKEPGRRFSTAGRFAQALATFTGLDTQTDSLQLGIVLVLVDPDGREYPVHKGRTTIGRDAGNDIVIPINQVSRHHAQIQYGQAGCTVTDMGSTNGTSINGAATPPDVPQPISPGDALGIGPIALTVTLPYSSDPVDPKTVIDLRPA